MQIDRIKGMEVVRLTAEEYENFYGESISERFKWVSDYVDPDEVRKATLKAWGLLKLNDHMIYEERAKRWL